MASKQAKKKSKKSASTTTAIVMITIVAIIAVTVGAFYMIIDHYLNLIEYVDPNDTAGNILPGGDEFDTENELGDIEGNGSATEPPVVNHEDIVWPGAADITDLEDDKLINILLVGQDRRSGDAERRLSDTMMLVSVNPDTNKASVISFLRDTYVQIPGGYKDNRLNTPYKNGGFKLLKETIKLNFGVTIDGCFECDFYDFKDIIDILGGVEIDVTEKEAEHIRSYIHVDIEAGLHNLTGEQALAYARVRRIDSDFKRTERQRTIMTTLFKKFKDASVGELKNIADEILPKLATDMTKSQVLGLLAEMLPKVSSMEVKTFSIPSSGTYTSAKIRGMDVLVPNLVLIRQKLAEEMLPF